MANINEGKGGLRHLLKKFCPGDMMPTSWTHNQIDIILKCECHWLLTESYGNPENLKFQFSQIQSKDDRKSPFKVTMKSN